MISGWRERERKWMTHERLRDHLPFEWKRHHSVTILDHDTFYDNLNQLYLFTLFRGPCLKIGHYNHAGNCCYLLRHSGHENMWKIVWEMCHLRNTVCCIYVTGSCILAIGLYILVARSCFFLNILLDDKNTCGLDGDGTTHFFAYRWFGRCEFECRQKQEMFRVLQNVQTVPKAHRASYSMGNCNFSGVKRSDATSSEVKNDCVSTSTTCFSCSSSDLNLLVTNFIFCIHVK